MFVRFCLDLYSPTQKHAAISNGKPMKNDNATNSKHSEPLIVSVSGLRGIVGESLTDDVAAAYACSFIETLPAGPVLIGRDGRESGPALKESINKAIVASGRDVLDCDVASTPTIGVAIVENNAAGGIQISASHNPAPYNGLKLFSSGGRVLPAVAGDAVRLRFEALRRSPPKAQKKPTHGCVRAIESTLPHLHKVLSIVNVDSIRKVQPKVWIDCGHGAGSRLARPLLEALGCEVTVVGEPPDGQFEHEPEPTADNLIDWLPQIPAAGADIGFFQDPDADRLAVASHDGVYLGEELTLALAADAVLMKSPGPVVINCSTSQLTAYLAKRHGSPCTLSAVGEANVVDEMLKRNAVLGGEGNGGVIDPRVGLVRDSFVAMALILERMAEGGALTPLTSLIKDFPPLTIKKTKIVLPFGWSKQDIKESFQRVADAFPEATVSRLDGVRIAFADGWLLARASNTEPVVRIIAECADEQQAMSVIEQSTKALLNQS